MAPSSQQQSEDTNQPITMSTEAKKGEIILFLDNPPCYNPLLLFLKDSRRKSWTNNSQGF